MPSASFTSSRSYVRRSRRKGANRIALPNRPTGNIMDPMLQNSSSTSPSQINANLIQNHSAMSATSSAIASAASSATNTNASSSTSSSSSSSCTSSSVGVLLSLKQSMVSSSSADMYDASGPSCSKSQSNASCSHAASSSSSSNTAMAQLGSSSASTSACNQMPIFNTPSSPEYVGMHINDNEAGPSSSGKIIQYRYRRLII